MSNTGRSAIFFTLFSLVLVLTGCGGGAMSNFASAPTTTTGPTPTTGPATSGGGSAQTVPGYAQLMSLPFQAGITHIDGRYGFVQENFLVEGAQKIADLGAPAIFVYMTGNFRTSYPDRGSNMWPTADPFSLTELAKTAPFQKVFSMPFKTIVITAYTMANGDDISKIYSDPNAAAAEEKEFYDFAHYLYSNYGGTGKTFVLKHWEGDFIGLHGFDASQDISQQSVNQMIAWEKARQHGVTRARQEAGKTSGIGVFNAAEVSLVADADKHVRVINSVIPQVAPDMVTYSSWDSSMQGSDYASAAASLNQALDTIKRLAPDPLSLGNKRILISEYGVFERNHPADAVWRAQAILDTSKSAGILGTFFWELFDNECTDPGGNYFATALLPSDPQRPQNSNCKGLSIIRPDGSASPTLPVLQEFWQN